VARSGDVDRCRERALSILFATLAGVSIALVSGGARAAPRGPR
jgi:hypothetical protein